MKHLLLSVIAVIAIFFSFTGTAQAQQNPFDLSFPIAELGNCGSVDECRTYCDDPDHGQACHDWAVANGFAEEHPTATVPDVGGPGGCQSDTECRAYCDQEANHQECIEFSLTEGHISPEEAERALRGGPGGCRSEASCDAFCSQPDNHQTCINFAVEEGYLTTTEAERLTSSTRGRADDLRRGPSSRLDQVDIHEDEGPDIDEEKAQALIAEIGGPGGCSSFESCGAFCEDPQHGEVCFDYALEQGLFEGSDEEIETLKRLATLKGPGGCVGEECRDYCEEPGHEEECYQFALKNGLIDENEAREIKKFIEATEDGGPGGCKGRECEMYCQEEKNHDECFLFAKENNLLSEEEIADIERFEKLDEKVRTEGGPGGCRGEDECHAYCSKPEHIEECANFAVSEGFLKPEEIDHEFERFLKKDEFGTDEFESFGEDFPVDAHGFSPHELREEFFPPDFERLPPEVQDAIKREFEGQLKAFEEGGQPPEAFFTPHDHRDTHHHDDFLPHDESFTKEFESLDGEFPHPDTFPDISDEAFEKRKALKELEERGIAPEALKEEFEGFFPDDSHGELQKKHEEEGFSPSGSFGIPPPPHNAPYGFDEVQPYDIDTSVKVDDAFLPPPPTGQVFEEDFLKEEDKPLPRLYQDDNNAPHMLSTVISALIRLVLP